MTTAWTLSSPERGCEVVITALCMSSRSAQKSILEKKETIHARLGWSDLFGFISRVIYHYPIWGVWGKINLWHTSLGTTIAYNADAVNTVGAPANITVLCAAS